MAGSPCLGLLRGLRQPTELRGHIPFASQMGLPQFTCRTQSCWLGCRSQSSPLHAASRCSSLGLATHFPSAPAHRLTFTAGIRGQKPYVYFAPGRMPPIKPCRWRRRFQPTDADQPVRVPQPSSTQPRGASWLNGFASRPVFHGLRHPANVRQVTAASAHATSQQMAGSRLVVSHDKTICIPNMLKPRLHHPGCLRRLGTL